MLHVRRHPASDSEEELVVLKMCMPQVVESTVHHLLLWR